VRELAAAGQAWALVVGSLVFVAFSVVGGWYLIDGDVQRGAGWFTYAFMALLLFYSTHYLQMTFRSSHDFARLSIVNMVESAVALALLTLVALWSFYGLCARLLLAGAVAGVLLYRWRPIRVRPRWKTRHWRHLLMIGAPIFGVGLLYSWWGGVINSTLVLWFAGTEGVGLYSMVLLAVAAIDVVPQAVAQVVYPRMSEQYGRGSKIENLVAIARKPMLLTASVMIPIIVAAWFLVPPFMRTVLPAYAEAAPAMRWALLLGLATTFQPLNSVFNVVRRQDLYTVAIVLGIASYALSLLVLLSGQVTLTAFPQAMLIGRVVYVLVSYWLLVRLRRREQSLGRRSSSEDS
jgi:O-antigen/teichoic acid export membrane protein